MQGHYLTKDMGYQMAIFSWLDGWLENSPGRADWAFCPKMISQLLYERESTSRSSDRINIRVNVGDAQKSPN